MARASQVISHWHPGAYRPRPARHALRHDRGQLRVRHRSRLWPRQAPVRTSRSDRDGQEPGASRSFRGAWQKSPAEYLRRGLAGYSRESGTVNGRQRGTRALLEPRSICTDRADARGGGAGGGAQALVRERRVGERVPACGGKGGGLRWAVWRWLRRPLRDIPHVSLARRSGEDFRRRHSFSDSLVSRKSLLIRNGT